MKIFSAVIASSFAVLTCSLLAAQSAKTEHGDHVDEVMLPKHGAVFLLPTEGNDVTGQLKLEATDEGLHITGTVKNLSPGEHGFHIHEFGDLSSKDGSAAGGHFTSAAEHKHGELNAETSHEGDLGNITADGTGVAKVDVVSKLAKLHFVLGRSIVVHAGKDDLSTQPSGDSGARVAVGIIGLTKD